MKMKKSIDNGMQVAGIKYPIKNKDQTIWMENEILLLFTTN